MPTWSRSRLVSAGVFAALLPTVAVALARADASPRLEVEVQGGAVSVTTEGVDFTAAELRALEARIAADVYDSPLRESGGAHVVLRGQPVRELRSRLRAVDVKDSRAVEDAVDGFIEARFERGRDQPLTEPVEVLIGRSFELGRERSLGSVVAIGSSAAIDGEVADLIAIGSQVRVTERASVTNRLLSVGSQVEIAPGARVSAQELRISLPAFAAWGRGFRGAEAGPPLATRLVRTLLGILLSFTLGVLWMRHGPVFHGQVQERLARGPWSALGLGLLHSLAIVPAAVLLVLTLVGIVLLPLYLVALGLVLWLGYVAGAAGLGRLIARALGAWQRLLLGLLVLAALSWIPIAGALAAPLATTFGVGALMTTFYRRVRARRRRGPAVPIEDPSPVAPAEPTTLSARVTS